MIYKIGILLIALSFGFLACTNGVKSNKEAPKTAAIVDSTQFKVTDVKEVVRDKNTFRSSLKPNDTTLLNKIYTDTIELNSKAIKFLWRAAEDDVVLGEKYNDIVINQSFCNSISYQEKAALAFVATFIGNACIWDGKVNKDRSNLKCKILTALNLGYQCSDTHLGFLKHWFSQDEKALKKLEVCVTMPETATERSIFDEITIETDEDQYIITVTSKVIVVNMKESKSWQYTQTDTFAFTCESIDLINSQKSEITYND